ncbi:MAG: hypothetical protein ACKO4S_07480 [Snowella sp.]
MKLRSYSLFFITTYLVLAFTPILAVSAQSKGDYYQSVATSCEKTLNASGRKALWQDISAAAVKDTQTTSGDSYNKRITEHCEWNLRGDKPLWNQIRNKAIASLPIPNPSYYQERLAAHCEWSLNHTNHTNWWRDIREAAIQGCGKYEQPLILQARW